VFVLLDCSPIGGDICTCRNRRADADGRHDIFDKEESRHECTICQRDATAAREAVTATFASMSSYSCDRMEDQG
jgi:hypothetical protein